MKYIWCVVRVVVNVMVVCFQGSPHGSVMSCQSLAARAFAEPEKDSRCGVAFHRSVRFSSESRSTRGKDIECKRETPGSMSLTTLSVSPMTPGSNMCQSAPNAFEFDECPGPPALCRFPKLEECAHFHYERVSLGGLRVELVPCETNEGTPQEGPQESIWWRGKRGFRVGFFPHHCVAVIGDKVPRHMTQPPPIVGSVAVAPIKPVLRKHGKLISLFRSFILSRPSRRSLKQQGILRERVFGCDLGEHLLNCGHDVPQVLVECARAIELRGAVDGIYRLSGGAALTQRLRSGFDASQPPDLSAAIQRDPHALASLLKCYFRICKDRDSPLSSTSDFQQSPNVKLRERNSPRKQKNSARYSAMHAPIHDNDTHSRLTWHGKDGHSTLIKIDWPVDSIGNLTSSTLNSSATTPVTPAYDPLESDSEASDNKHTIKITSNDCDNCDQEKCLKCELKATDYENMKDLSRDYSEQNLRDSLEASPLHSTEISYQNLNRLSAVSTSSNSEQISKRDTDLIKIMTSSHESSSSYSNVSLKQDELYECFNFTRPNYINLQSSSTSKSSPGSPLKSPLKSTISITFRSPTKDKTPDYEPIGNDTPTNERDSVYEDVDLEKNLSIVEEATVPETDASLPTQQACQPSFNQDLIILETPTETNLDDVDVYSQVKFFRRSIDEVNAMILETPEKETQYQNIAFDTRQRDYENINVDTLKICDKIEISSVKKNESLEHDNGNITRPIIASNLNVRELAIRFESPTEQKGPFTFEKFKTEVKYPSLERKDEIKIEKKKDLRLPPPVSPKTSKLSKNSCNARSLDENAFVKEFGNEKDRRKSLEVKEVKKSPKYLPDLNLNTEEPETKAESITPTSENKISLIQRFEMKPDTKNSIDFETEKKLSRERIEKYKEERRNFLREKYSSQSFRSSPEQLTRLKLKKEEEKPSERLKDVPMFERRNTVDLGQRIRFSLARSANNLDSIPSPLSPVKDIDFRNGEGSQSREDRREKLSPSYNIRDMAAMFEQKSHSNTNAG
ncbi:unnamed protein product [Leptidea sinapis]|uniref:Rho-GAP domain-containing protein n=1 Tax=Leptidea sinapis TaxID=189913 RepID=A0A5E4R6B2_9NEOP|nr:unnamed protein product [Leptidea sinapis]